MTDRESILEEIRDAFEKQDEEHRQLMDIFGVKATLNEMVALDKKWGQMTGSGRKTLLRKTCPHIGSRVWMIASTSLWKMHKTLVFRLTLGEARDVVNAVRAA